MIISLETRKGELMAFIATLQQEESIIALEKTVRQIGKTTYKTKKIPRKVSDKSVKYFQRPMKATITIEELVQQQPRKPMNEDTIDAIIKKMAISEPIEVLLAQLNS